MTSSATKAKVVVRMGLIARKSSHDLEEERTAKLENQVIREAASSRQLVFGSVGIRSRHPSSRSRILFYAKSS